MPAHFIVIEQRWELPSACRNAVSGAVVRVTEKACRRRDPAAEPAFLFSRQAHAPTET